MRNERERERGREREREAEREYISRATKQRKGERGQRTRENTAKNKGERKKCCAPLHRTSRMPRKQSMTSGSDAGGGAGLPVNTAQVQATSSGRDATLASVTADTIALQAQLEACEAHLQGLECTREALQRERAALQERLLACAGQRAVFEGDDGREGHGPPPRTPTEPATRRQQREAAAEAKAGENGPIPSHGVVEVRLESDTEAGTEEEPEETPDALAAIRHQCAGCGNTGYGNTNFPMCYGCRVTRYCDRGCQRRHFQAGHQQVCARVREPRTRRRTARMVQRQARTRRADARLEQNEAIWEVRVEAQERLQRLGFNVNTVID